MTLPDDIAEIYARVLIAIARADREITTEEGHELDRIITERATGPMSLADLMFAPTVRPEELLKLLGSTGEGGPFRTTALDVAELARMLIDDALTIVFAKGSINAGEESSLIRFAAVLGVSKADVSAQIARVARIGS